MNDFVRRSEILFGLNVFSDDENGNEHFLNGIETAKEIVEDAIAVDAVPVVRCKDCKHYDHEERTGWCNLNSYFYPGGMDWSRYDEEDYCSYGERIDDDK